MAVSEMNCFGGGGTPDVKMYTPASADYTMSGSSLIISNVVGTVVGVVVRYTASGYVAAIVSDTETGYYAATTTENFSASTSYKFSQSGTTVTVGIATASPQNIHVVYYTIE